MKVKYEGPLGYITRPGGQGIVKRGDEIEVPDDWKMLPGWASVSKTKAKAKSKKEDDK